MCFCVEKQTMGNRIYPINATGGKINRRVQSVLRSTEVLCPFPASSFRTLQESVGEWFSMNLWHCSALVCRLANHSDVLLPLCPQLFYSHTRKHKSLLCLREHSGGSHLTLPELDAYQELIPACLRGQTITPSDQSEGDTWHLNSSSCSVYIMYIPRQWARGKVTEGKDRNQGVSKGSTMVGFSTLAYCTGPIKSATNVCPKSSGTQFHSCWDYFPQTDKRL